MSLSSRSTAVLALAALLGCGSPEEDKPVTPPPSPSLQPAAATVPSALDSAFFARLVRKELGDGSGAIELRAGGILIHPGNTTPTSATFRLDGTMKQLRLKLYIASLGPTGSAIPDAGTVNARFIADGREIFKTYVDRTSLYDTSLDVSGVKELVIRVDNNGQPWFDWFHVSVQSAT